MNKKVFVGMSGGVDSSVAAALLKQQGYEVTGIYMKNWTKDLPGLACPWQEDYEDALSVAVALEIDLKVYDFEKDYRNLVVNYMVEEYKKGLTPNPDIMCNQEVKFKLFLKAALGDGADLIASGHYARINKGRLYKGLDKTKDQSYFLYRMDKTALERTLMPLGAMTKTQVRQLASSMNLTTANKKDSQGICFVGQIGIRQFLESELGPQPAGDIIDQSGNKIGRHNGAIYYTIGQRHGLNLGGGLPYYVTKKDIKNNIVYVTTNLNDHNLWRSELDINDCHWLIKPNEKTNYAFKLRYNSSEIKGKLKSDHIVLDEPIKGLAAGQSAVAYKDDLVIGGGIIC